MFKVRATLPSLITHPSPLADNSLWCTYFLRDVFILIKIHDTKVLAGGWKSQPLHSSVEGCLTEVLRDSPKVAGTEVRGIEFQKTPSSEGHSGLGKKRSGALRTRVSVAGSALISAAAGAFSRPPRGGSAPIQTPVALASH